MLRKVRQLRLSLAAKCQLLFGAAVVLIIGAALFVPWQRIEQLMEQLNHQAANTLTDYALLEHGKYQQMRQRDEVPSDLPIDPTRADRAPVLLDPNAHLPPRLIGLDAGADRLTRFEQRAIDYFVFEADSPYFFQYGREGQRYRYARPVVVTESCLPCHTAVVRPGAPNVSIARPADADRYPVDPASLMPPPRVVGMIGIVTVDIPNQVEANQLLLNRVFILTAGLFAGTLAIIVFYLITTRLFLQPVRVLQDAAEKVSEGDLNIRADVSTGDEFQTLSETFNAMLTNLKISEDQLRSMNRNLDLKLGELAETNVALYESNRLKSEFLANVSHELRTPLNSILGFAELIKDVQSGDAKTVRYVQNILTSGRNLLELINDLLDLAKIEAGRMEVRSEKLSLNDLFEALSGLLKPLLTSKNLTLNPSVAPGVPILQTDPAKLQQVLYNFLSNAIKFSPQGTSIDLRAALEPDGRVRLSVTDRGSGIDPEKHDVIFEKFKQIDGSHTRQHSGTGLGLAISKDLTTLLGGTIGVSSFPGEGATFWIVLPLQIHAESKDVRAKLVMN